MQELNKMYLSFTPRAAWFVLCDDNYWVVTNQTNPAALGVILSGIFIAAKPYENKRGIVKDGTFCPLDKDGFPALPTPPNSVNTLSAKQGGTLIESLKITATARQRDWLDDNFGGVFVAPPARREHKAFYEAEEKWGRLDYNLLKSAAHICGIEIKLSTSCPEIGNYFFIAKMGNAVAILSLWGATASNPVATISVTEEPGLNRQREILDLIAFELGIKRIETLTY